MFHGPAGEFGPPFGRRALPSPRPRFDNERPQALIFPSEELRKIVSYCPAALQISG